MEAAVKLYSLDYNNVVSFLCAFLLLPGYMILPQIFHLVPQGGITWLPIYFFTLVAAYKYGWKVGLLTGVLSPVINSLFFGMPAFGLLPVILLKSVLLAMAAGFAAYRFQRVSLLVLLGVVLFYQVLGTLGEWAIEGSFFVAVQDFRIGLPGMALQVIGGYLFVKHLIRN